MVEDSKIKETEDDDEEAREEIKEEVWQQLKAGLNGPGRDQLIQVSK